MSRRALKKLEKELEVAALHVTTIEMARERAGLPDHEAENQYVNAAVTLAQAARPAWSRGSRDEVIALFENARQHPMLRVDNPHMWLNVLRIAQEELPGFPADRSPSSSEAGGGGEPPAMPVAGWYPDPWLQADLRYWSGSEWTGHVTARPM